LAIKNLFNTTPPFVATDFATGFAPGYSTYGDPRGRRFVLSMRAEF
jgi:outer membrane receptor protein involved in Fe transport